MLGKKLSFSFSSIKRGVAVLLFGAVLPAHLAAGVAGSALSSPSGEVFDITTGSDPDNELDRAEIVEKVRMEIAGVVEVFPRTFKQAWCADGVCPFDRQACESSYSVPLCSPGTYYSAAKNACVTKRNWPPYMVLEHDKIYKEASHWWFFGKGVDTPNTSFWVRKVPSSGRSTNPPAVRVDDLKGKNGRYADSVVVAGIHVGVVSSRTPIHRQEAYLTQQWGCSSSATIYGEWGSITFGCVAMPVYVYGTYWLTLYGYESLHNTVRLFKEGNHRIPGTKATSIYVKPGYEVFYGAEYKQYNNDKQYLHIRFRWSRSETEEVPSGTPWCPTGTEYVAGMQACRDYRCPIGNYPCKGSGSVKYCSPYLCDEENRCTVGTCPYSPSTRKIMPASTVPSNVKLTGSSDCYDAKCDAARSRRVSYCGGRTKCPEGMGVFEEGGRCYREVCPVGSYEMDGVCYRKE